VFSGWLSDKYSINIMLNEIIDLHGGRNDIGGLMDAIWVFLIFDVRSN
jgi:hypothetical protein